MLQQHYLIAQRAVRRARAPRAPWTNRIAKAKQPQMEKRQATSTYRKAKVDQQQMDKWQTNIDPQSQTKTPKRHLRTENWPQDGRKWHHKRPKMVPRRGEEGAKTIPNRKSNQKAHQDEPKTILGLAQGRIWPAQPPPPGAIWEAKSGSKPIPKRSKIEAIIEEKKTSSQDGLGPVLERSWVVLGRHVGAKNPQSIGKRNIS